MKTEELLKNGIKILEKEAVQDSKIKAKVLLKFVLQKNEQQLVASLYDEVSLSNQEKYLCFLQEILQGKPLQYITNNQEFMGLNFYVDENVLIPQPDTEILVQEVIKITEEKLKEKSHIEILDLCTGSGAIAIALKHYFKDSVLVYGTDISKEAVQVAKKNAEANNSYVNFLVSDRFKSITKTFDIIVSNPPYIETNVIKNLTKDVRKEPHIALDGGKDGLEFYRVISNEGHKFLKEDGYILVEIGYKQKQSVIKIFGDKSMYEIMASVKDLASNDRVIIVRRT